MTLEILQKPSWVNVKPVPYRLGGVKEITDQTEYGENHFAITIFDTRIYFIDAFEYIKNADTGEFFIKDGEWVKEMVGEHDV